MTMTNGNQDDLREQVELLKGYADQGRSVPLVSGAKFIVWGLVVATSGLLSRSALVGGDSASVSWIWVGATVTGWLASIAVRRFLHLDSREGGVTHGNQVARVVWLTAGVVISVYANIAIFTKNGMATIPVVSMLISGLAFNATAAASTLRVLYIAGVGYLTMGLSAVAFRWNGADTLLAVAVGGLLFLVLPGLYLVLHARSRAR